jgi:type 2 lantibiotic biosynthesis protein LanM
MDIPYFSASTSSTALPLAPDYTIEAFFAESGHQRVVDRVSRLNIEDLEQQIRFIYTALYSRIASVSHGSPKEEKLDLPVEKTAPSTSKAKVDQAVRIATALERLAIRSSDGSVTWIGLDYLPSHRQFQLQPMGHTLYSGCIGVGLFLAALERVTGGIGFRDLALGTLQTLRQRLRDARASYIITRHYGIGGITGIGSMIYVLCRMSEFLNESALLDDAERATTLVTPQDIVTDDKFDITTGAAGTILGLLAFHNATHNGQALEQASTCGYHLLDERRASDSGYRAWRTPGSGRFLTGFSHGAAGIGYALLRLYEVTGETSFLEGAQEAFAYEHSVFVPEMENWPDFRRSMDSDGKVEFSITWCHGAPGIGLARLGGLSLLDTVEIREQIEAALRTTQRFGLQGLDRLCCGTFGRVEVLLEASRRLSRPDLLETAKRLAASAISRAEKNGSFRLFDDLSQDIYDPSFFLGSAGIGYELLKLAYPNTLPSVMLLE